MRDCTPQAATAPSTYTPTMITGTVSTVRSLRRFRPMTKSTAAAMASTMSRRYCHRVTLMSVKPAP